jgi:hypothetical protein
MIMVLSCDHHCHAARVAVATPPHSAVRNLILLKALDLSIVSLIPGCSKFGLLQSILYLVATPPHTAVSCAGNHVGFIAMSHADRCGPAARGDANLKAFTGLPEICRSGLRHHSMSRAGVRLLMVGRIRDSDAQLCDFLPGRPSQS